MRPVRTRATRPEQPQAGFTIVELLVAMVLLGILGAIAMTSMISATQGSRRAESRTTVSNALALGAQRVARQVRAAAPIVKNGSTPMTGTDVTVQVYRSNVRYRHRFAVTPASGGTNGYLTETVSEFADETSVTPVSTSSRRLVDDLDNVASDSVFRYYDRSGAQLDPATTTASRVARVIVELRGKPREGRMITVRTSVFLRNYREF